MELIQTSFHNPGPRCFGNWAKDHLTSLISRSLHNVEDNVGVAVRRPKGLWTFYLKNFSISDFLSVTWDYFFIQQIVHLTKTYWFITVYYLLCNNFIMQTSLFVSQKQKLNTVEESL